MLPSIFVENLFDDFFGDAFDMMPSMLGGRDPLYGKNADHIMRTDVREVGDNYEVDIDLPGYKKDEIHLELKDGYLNISAVKSIDKDEKDKEGRFIRRERYAGSCSRSFYVGEMKQSDIRAKFEDGILKLTMPKTVKKELPERTLISIE